MKIFVNGWDLSTHPHDPHSLFTLEWLNGLAAAQPHLELSLVVPDQGRHIQGAAGFKIQELSAGLSAMAQIRFEQRQLVNYARLNDAEVVLYPTGGAPFNASLPVVTFPPLTSAPRNRSFGGRLSWAVRSVGNAAAYTQIRILDPGEKMEDRPEGADLEAWVSSRFTPLKESSDQDVLSRFDLKPGYLLSLVQDQHSLGRILDVWRWLTDAVDPGGPLVLMGIMDEWMASTRALITRLGLENWATILAGVTLDDLAVLYRQAACYFHGAPSRSGQELRWALASGVPVAGIETPASTRIIGEAGYLAPARDVRALAAACITVIVEPQMADILSTRGLTRARAYHHERIFDTLADVLKRASQK